MEDLYAGYLETTLAPGELITRVSLPAMDGRRGFLLHEGLKRVMASVSRGNEFIHPALRFAVTFPEGWDITNGDAQVVQRERVVVLASFAARNGKPDRPASAPAPLLRKFAHAVLQARQPGLEPLLAVGELVARQTLERRSDHAVPIGRRPDR